MTILLVEDHEFLRESLRTVLTSFFPKSGIDIIEAEDGRKAKMLIEKGLRPDLVLTDQSMPKMTGIELVAWIKGDSGLKHIPAVLMSIDDISPDKHQADAFASKTDFHAIELAVRSFLKT